MEQSRVCLWDNGVAAVNSARRETRLRAKSPDRDLAGRTIMSAWPTFGTIRLVTDWPLLLPLSCCSPLWGDRPWSSAVAWSSAWSF